MMKALGKLGIGSKSKPAKEDEISRHKSMVSQLQQWKQQAAEVQDIIKTLQDAYASAKGEFALSRYEDLKGMIKSAVQQHRDLEARVKSGAFKVSQCGGGSQAPGRKVGAITKLRLQAESFASSQEDVKDHEPDYTRMTSKEAQSSVDEMRKELLQHKQSYYSQRDRLTQLAKDYEESKKYDPTKRYNVLKQLVKGVTLS